MASSVRPLIFGCVLCFALNACGGGGGGGGGGNDSATGDSTAPTASIHFPGPRSATEGDSIIVRGTANDASDVTVVRVNGVDATSRDNFATWQARVALSPGNNRLTVETGDIARNASRAAASGEINAMAK